MVVAFLASDLSNKTAQVSAPEALAGLIVLIRRELIMAEQPGKARAGHRPAGGPPNEATVIRISKGSSSSLLGAMAGAALDAGPHRSPTGRPAIRSSGTRRSCFGSATAGRNPRSAARPGIFRPDNLGSGGGGTGKAARLFWGKASGFPSEKSYSPSRKSLHWVRADL